MNFIKKNWWIIAIVVVIIAVLVWYFGFNKKEETTNAVNTNNLKTNAPAGLESVFTPSEMSALAGWKTLIRKEGWKNPDGSEKNDKQITMDAIWQMMETAKVIDRSKVNAAYAVLA